MTTEREPPAEEGLEDATLAVDDPKVELNQFSYEYDDGDVDPIDMEEVGEQEDHHPTPRENTSRRRVAMHADVREEISYHPGRFQLYSPPRQRQKWGDTQSLPRVNWGDLFFDLFYVAATYNVSVILVDSPTRQGLLYAAGTFCPVLTLWTDKVTFDARFVYEDDLYHRIFQLVNVLILATAVLHIRPVAILENAAQEPSMMAFALALVLDEVWNFCKFGEIFCFGIGQDILRAVALHDSKYHLIAFVFYVAALAVAAKEFYGGDSNGAAHRLLAEVTTTSTDSTANATDASIFATSSTDTTDIPIYLCLAGFAAARLSLAAKVIFWFPNDGSHKQFIVPLNVNFALHRNGEWIMLMLGESIFSLLIVDVPAEGSGYFGTFFCGLLTVIFLSILHFRSQPHEADYHALRRNKDAGVMWKLTNIVYSLALVTLGAAYTFFLMDFFVDDESASVRRVLASSSSDESYYSAESLRIRAAHMFSGALAISFASLDFINFLHVGWKEGKSRCVCPATRRKNVKGMVLVMLRLSVVLFTATLSQWMTEPELLSLIGLICVLLQLVMRLLGNVYLTHSQVHVLDPTGEHCDVRSHDEK